MTLLLALSAAERTALVAMRDTDPKPYRRERAAALLKIADGTPAARVAQHGLLRPRDPDSVYGWLHRYQAEGLAGLTIRPGRGRPPAASPPAHRSDGGPGGADPCPGPHAPRLCDRPESLDAQSAERRLLVAGAIQPERPLAAARALG